MNLKIAKNDWMEDIAKENWNNLENLLEIYKECQKRYYENENQENKKLMEKIAVYVANAIIINKM